LIRFQREAASEILKDIIPLTFKHYAEIARFKDIPLDPDFESYLHAEEHKILRIYTARKEDAIVGYAIFYLRPHPHYRKSIQAFSTLLFIHPDHRGFGMSFFLF
jgi:RecJ-like exonuclease